MKPILLVLVLCLLPGCSLIPVRFGCGVAQQGEGKERTLLHAFEAGLNLPASEGLTLSVLSVNRRRDFEARDARPILGVEVARILNNSRSTQVNLVGGRFEVGRDEFGKYIGGAAVVRRVVKTDIAELSPSFSLVLSVGSYTGSFNTLNVGLHALVGLW